MIQSQAVLKGAIWQALSEHLEKFPLDACPHSTVDSIRRSQHPAQLGIVAKPDNRHLSGMDLADRIQNTASAITFVSPIP